MSGHFGGSGKLRRRGWLMTATALAGAAGALTGCGSAAVQVPGTIIFGSGTHRLSAYQWTVNNPHSTFREGKWMGWVARLKRPLASDSVTVSVYAGPHKVLIWQQTVPRVNPGFVQLADSAPVDAFTKVGTGGPVPGTYVLRYAAGGKVLAAGSFRVVLGRAAAK